MNWYCRFKFAQEYGHPNTYMDIGHHDDPSSDCDEWLWAFIDGQLYIEEGMPGSIHAQYWPQEALDRSFSGRYDGCRKQISIGVPANFPPGRQVPGAIIKLVERAFPESVGTYVFAPDSPAMAV